MRLVDLGLLTQSEPEGRAILLAKVLHAELVQHQESCWMGKRYVDSFSSSVSWAEDTGFIAAQLFLPWYAQRFWGDYERKRTHPSQ